MKTKNILSCYFRIKLLPLEILSLSATTIALTLHFLLKLKFYSPGFQPTIFSIKHYLIGVAISYTILITRTTNEKGKTNALRNILSLTLIIYLHFQFKLWSSIINKNNFDQFYQSLDNSITPLLTIISFINLGFSPIKSAIENPYHHLFVSLFFISFIVQSIKNHQKGIDELLLSFSLVLVLGGLSYSLTPAFGPFVFDVQNANLAQISMLTFSLDFLASNGQHYINNNFIMPLAAMPSLHTAHTLTLYHYARRDSRILSYLYIPVVIFILTEAITSKWHYSLDIIVGIILAKICIAITNNVYSAKNLTIPNHLSAKQRQGSFLARIARYNSWLLGSQVIKSSKDRSGVSHR
ncbi:phosphatase PAP2 family protein [Chitinibacter fontanus]|uniref:Phosphatase PAP2 family protein n=1 Tax=Chitinibacter fontanus TaxID=1737446 RepID=A0A7D5ZIA0_9NEIS|nr:phosphatase PAP2 family protein [Chitinibacter fontanus]